MPKSVSKSNGFATQTLTYCALLAALSVVLARLIIPMPNESTRFSIEAVPIYLAGVLFGPLAGALVGFSADFVGCLFSQYGYNPIFCIPPILYGLCGGLFRPLFKKGVTVPRLLLGFLPPVVLGSVLYQSAALSFVYNSAAFWPNFLIKLTSRSIQFSITIVIDCLIIFMLFRARLFERIGIWKKTAGKEPAAMTPQQAIEYIHSVFWKGSIPGLSRTQALLEKMGNPEKSLKYVHIAGTNGKGSTAAMTASILQKAGYRTGLYTSPYIYRFHERMQVNGKQITDDELVEVTQYVRPLADSLEDKPTEFELVCCIAFEFFKRQNCDIVVLEVGMGGEFDATNVIPVPEVAVITNIGLDHTDYLGSTLEEIAQTKAGIFKDGGNAVIYRGTPGVEAVFEQVCCQRNVSLKKANFESLKLISKDLEGQVFDCGQRKNLRLPLLGDHQLHNAAVVLSVADTLKEKGWSISESNIYDGIRDVSWPGRFDIVCRKPLFIIDGGHNPQCIEALEKNIRDYLADRKIIALTGVLADKDYADMYKPVMPYIHSFVCITPPNPRRLEASALAEHLRSAGAQTTACNSIEQGVNTAMELAGEYGVVLCFGSLYTIGDIHTVLENML